MITRLIWGYVGLSIYLAYIELKPFMGDNWEDEVDKMLEKAQRPDFKVIFGRDRLRKIYFIVCITTFLFYPIEYAYKWIRKIITGSDIDE